jgi:CBS domain-containing protein
MELNDIFTKHVITAEPFETLAAVTCKMLDHNVGTVIIVEDRRPVGIVTDRDLALALGAQGFGIQTQVQKVMSKHVLAIPEDTGIYAATKFMRERGVRRLPVVDSQDCVVGIVTLDDVTRFLGREMYNLSQAIERELQVK